MSAYIFAQLKFICSAFRKFEGRLLVRRRKDQVTTSADPHCRRDQRADRPHAPAAKLWLFAGVSDRGRA
jgi:hypothetical protein